MRDGVRLHGTLFLPPCAEEPLPVVMMRNPYNGAAGPAFWDGLCVDLARHGYAVINQDVRGTGKSEGEFTPFFQEGPDGYDSVEWAAGQHWSNGNIGLWGISYLGVCVMQAATLRPPHLVAGTAHFTASDYHDHWTYDNGVFNDRFSEEWTSAFVRDRQLRRDRGIGPAADPARTGDSALQTSSATATPGFYADWLAHPHFDAYWAKIDLESRYSEINIPILMKGGWFDAFAAGTLRNFIGVRTVGQDSARSGSRLVMAPVCHEPWNSRVITFPNVPEIPPDMDASWWDQQLRGATVTDAAAPVRLYIMAPPARGRPTKAFGSRRALILTPAANLYVTRSGAATAATGSLCATEHPPARRTTSSMILPILYPRWAALW
jgi:uncharacterized protein